MINNFEVGSWIRTPDNEIVQILELDTINGTQNELSNDIICFNGYLETCILWHPNEGEWCLFWNNDLKLRQLLPYKSYLEGKYITSKNGVGIYDKNLCYINHFDNCEPFMGKVKEPTSDDEVLEVTLPI